MMDIHNLTFSAKQTILRQLLVGFLSFALGCLFIWLVSVGANKIAFYHEYRGDFIIALFAGPGFVFLIIDISKKQFKRSIDQTKIKAISIRSALDTWLFLSILQLVLLVLVLFIGVPPDFYFWMLAGLIDLFLLLTLFLAMGATVGSIYKIILNVHGYQYLNHLELLSNRASIVASSRGVLPYRIRVQAFWSVIFWFLMSIFALGSGFAFFQNDPSLILLLAAIVMLGFGVLGLRKAIQDLLFLIKPSLSSICEKVSDKSLVSARGITNYYVSCDNQRFTTDYVIWIALARGQQHKLWYSTVNKQIVAYEIQSSGSKHVPDQTSGSTDFTGVSNP